MKRVKEKFRRLLSHDIGIDLGTANTLVYLRGRGIIINEPSVVALNQKTGQVVAVGSEAKAMLGRTPTHISAIRPLVDGVISDFEITEEMLAYFLGKAQEVSGKLLSPRVVIGVPSGITSVEIRAVRDAAKSAGAGTVHIVEEPMAAAIGMRLPIHDPVGSMVLDIGGGTSDIAVLSMGGVVKSKNVRIAGDRFTADIISYVKDQFKILIGEKTAETVKFVATALVPLDGVLEARVKGRDLVTGLPREVIITDSDIREALSGSIEALVLGVREVLETTPPEVVADVIDRGIFLAGGGALLRGLPELLLNELGIAIHVASDPLSAVARGTGVILEDIEKFKDILIENEDELPTKN